MSQTWEHLVRNCCRLRDHQMEQLKSVGNVTGGRAGSCPNVQISDLFCIEDCDQAVMDIQPATEVRKFPPTLK